MVKILANRVEVQIIKTTNNQEVSEPHKNIFKDHFRRFPETYTVVKGVIWDSSPDLALDISFSNAKKKALIVVALIDALGEYLSWETLDKFKGPVGAKMQVSQEQIQITKRVTLLVAKQLEDNSISNAKFFELTIANFQPLPTSAFKGAERD